MKMKTQDDFARCFAERDIDAGHELVRIGKRLGYVACLSYRRISGSTVVGGQLAPGEALRALDRNDDRVEVDVTWWDRRYFRIDPRGSVRRRWTCTICNGETP